MLADRILGQKEALSKETAAAMAASKKMNAWSATRARGAQIVPAPTPDPGQVQPDFAAPAGDQSDPFAMPQQQAPLALSTPPAASYVGDRSRVVGLNEDMRSNKFSQGQEREAQRNTYQSPEQYEQHQQTVMDSPLLRQLQEGADRAAQLREAYIKNAPVMTDLSPVMAMADYLAKGKGTAQAGYKRPDSYDDMVSHISSLIGAEDKSRIAAAQLASEQTGPLKSGAESANVKTGLEQGQQAGSKEDQLHVPMIQPFQQANTITKNYQENPTVKALNDEAHNVNQMNKLLANPNWYTNRAVGGMAIKGMGFQRVTQGEFMTLGGGSRDLVNRVENMIRTGITGESLSPTDISTIRDFYAVQAKAIVAKQKQMHDAYQNGLLQYSSLGPGATGLLDQGDVKIDGQGATSDDKAAARAKELIQMLKDSRSAK